MKPYFLAVCLVLVVACGSEGDECDDAACVPSTEHQLSPVAATLTAEAKSIRDGTPLATLTREATDATPSAGATQPPSGGDSGITGIVLIGPQCPVVREGEECPDAPYEAFIGIRDAAGQAIASVASGADGRFRVELPQGTYTLVARPQTSTPIPAPVEMTVTVEAAEFTEIVVSMDSGIR